MIDKQDAFADLYLEYKSALERFVHYKIANQPDAEDILQEVLSSAFVSFDRLSDRIFFKPWIIGIAAHKCVDYYKQKAKLLELPLEMLENKLVGSHGVETYSLVQDTLDRLPDKDKQILYLFYFKDFSQNDIALRLHIPIGTVKSRISKAKQRFKALYPIASAHKTRIKKGGPHMKHQIFPERSPEILIKKSDQKPFSVRIEEIPGFLVVPRVGEKTTFAFYDDPDHVLTSVNKMNCVRPAEIHGLPCVEVEVEETDENAIGKRTLFLRLTETKCMYIAELSIRNGTVYFGSFMDSEWLSRYEVGEHNSGREIDQVPKGVISVEAEGSFNVKKEGIPDIIGRFSVMVGKREFDTVALVSVEEGILVIQYLNADGRTILWRRYNRDDWKLERYKQKWTEKLPGSERLKINGQTYVHWYDCIPELAL